MAIVGCTSVALCMLSNQPLRTLRPCHVCGLGMVLAWQESALRLIIEKSLEIDVEIKVRGLLLCAITCTSRQFAHVVFWGFVFLGFCTVFLVSRKWFDTSMRRSCLI